MVDKIMCSFCKIIDKPIDNKDKKTKNPKQTKTKTLKTKKKEKTAISI